jgi:hypothetical protein
MISRKTNKKEIKMKKQPAKNLKKIAFPKCATYCKALDYFGVCECESICPEKFEKKSRLSTKKHLTSGFNHATKN